MGLQAKNRVSFEEQIGTVGIVQKAKLQGWNDADVFGFGLGIQAKHHVGLKVAGEEVNLPLGLKIKFLNAELEKASGCKLIAKNAILPSLT